MKTIKAYRYWVRRFVRFHGLRHPMDLGPQEVRTFLEHLAVHEKVAESTQTQALCALVFLYGHVLGRPFGALDQFARPRRQKRLPVVLTDAEARSVLDLVAHPHQLPAMLMYGAGLRVGEAASLRIKDIDFDRREIILRDTKTRRDRVTMLPASLVGELQRQIERVKAIHADDGQHGRIVAPLPAALDRKKPGASRELAWRLQTTQLYLHLLGRGAFGVRSPLD